LHENTVTFSTVKAHERAQLFKYTNRMYNLAFRSLLLGSAAFFTENLMVDYARQNPNNTAGIARLRGAAPEPDKKRRKRIRKFFRDTIERAGSSVVQEQVQRDLLRLCASEPGFIPWSRTAEAHRLTSLYIDSSTFCNENWVEELDRRWLPAWHIPSKADLDSRGKLVRCFSPINIHITAKTYPLEHYRFSAAAAAIDFLQHVSMGQRTPVQKVVLLEDHKSVLHSSAHVQGLIPFLRKNPKLRVERRVPISRTVISQNSLYMCEFATVDVIEFLEKWINEALALKGHIPPRTFSLVLVTTAESRPEIWEALSELEEAPSMQDVLDKTAPKGQLRVVI
jgi:hypothetical protein